MKIKMHIVLLKATVYFDEVVSKTAFWKKNIWSIHNYDITV